MVKYSRLSGTSWVALVMARRASSAFPFFANSRALLNSFSAAFWSRFDATDFGPSAAAQARQKKSDRMAKRFFTAGVLIVPLFRTILARNLACTHRRIRPQSVRKSQCVGGAGKTSVRMARLQVGKTKDAGRQRDHRRSYRAGRLDVGWRIAHHRDHGACAQALAGQRDAVP